VAFQAHRHDPAMNNKHRRPGAAPPWRQVARPCVRREQCDGEPNGLWPAANLLRQQFSAASWGRKAEARVPAER